MEPSSVRSPAGRRDSKLMIGRRNRTCAEGDLTPMSRRLTHHELGVEPQHAIPAASECPIAPRVGVSPCLVIRAVDLDDEPKLWSQEIDDVPSEDGNLETERDAELHPAHGFEEPSFAWRRLVPHVVGAFGEESRARITMTNCAH